jgi:PAS domain S-box-containing protein
MGYSWKGLVHPDDLSAVIDYWQSHLQAGQDMPPYEFRFLHRNGEIRWASSSVAMLKNAAGNIVGQIATLQDITERKAVELRFRNIYEQAPLGIALIDSDSGRFLQINPKYEQLIRRTEAQMIELTFRDIIYPEDLAEDLDNMALLLAGKIRRFQLEKRLVQGDGCIMWARQTVVPMWRVGESPTYHLAIVEDITEWKVMEEVVREAQARFRAFMENSPAYAWAKDEQGRFVYVNKAFAERFHTRPDDWLGKTDFELWPREIAQAFWDSDRRVLANGEPTQATEESLSAGNERRYWFKSKFLFQDSGNQRFVGGVGIDVTELKRTEESLRAEQALLGNMIVVQEQEKQFLCHEFHDGLIQYAAGALMSLEGYRRNRPATEDLAMIDMVIAKLREGIDDGRRVIRGIRPAVLDDSELEAAIQDLIEQFSNSDIMVTFKCDKSIGRLPETVQTTVYRIVQEALNNARKYSGTDVVRIELQKSHGQLHLEIRDFGCGFDVATARKRGFGLVGMTERVRLLGGECTIRSEKDVGTTITVRTPIPATSSISS